MNNTNLNWAIFPGCYEYHLRCRYQNPLFSISRREVSQTELEEAQQKDAKERAQFMEQVNALLPEMQDLLSKKQTVSNLLKFHRRIYDLIGRSGEIGGNLIEERRILTRLFVALDEDAKNSVADNLEATESLKKLREHLYGGAELQVNNFLAQLNREESPIVAEDVVPRFFSEERETIEKAMPYFRQSNMLKTLQRGITELMNTRSPDDILVHNPNFRDKVKLIFDENIMNNKDEKRKCSNCGGVLEDTGDRISKAQDYRRAQGIKEPNTAYWRCKNCGQSERREV